MATKIVTKNSSTAGAAPTATDLVQGELAVNVADKRLFTEDNGGSIVELGTNPYNFTANHNGSAKLATTSTGINVTGTATMDGLTVDGTSNLNGVAQVGGSTDLLYLSGKTGTHAYMSLGGSSTAEDFFIGADTAIPLIFRTSATERMRIDSSGNVSIGTSTTSAPLRVNVGTDQNCAINTSGGNPRITAFNDAANVSIPLAFNGSILKFEVGGSERMRIDSSGNVGIGISSGMTYPLTIQNNTNNSYVHFVNSTTGTAYNDGSQIGVPSGGSDLLILNRESANIKMYTADTERMRILSTGSVLFGQSVNDRPAEFAQPTGASIAGASGHLHGQYQSSVSGMNMLLNRKGTDGTILGLRKDGTTVGSIGTAGGDLLVNAQSLGVLQVGGASKYAWTDSFIYPTSNGTRDIGTSSFRFKDLYLSGGVYLGGTGAANKLDDYEEGTWTPALGGTWTTNPTNLSGTYTKVGRIVYITVTMTGGVKSSQVSGYLTGVPINIASGTGSVSDSSVADFGNCLFQNSNRVWLTATNLGTGTVYITGTYLAA